MYCTIWAFRVKPAQIEAFEAAYGPDGLWVQLFKKAPGYVRTELLKDRLEATRYLTADYWVDKQAYERFRLDFSAEYVRLDVVCEDYTEGERRIGEFEVQ